MGWWAAARDGSSFTGDGLWGDGPADLMDAAIRKIREEFRNEQGREPRIGEIRGGLEFALMRREDEDDASSLDEL